MGNLKARPRTTEVLLNPDTLVQDFRARGGQERVVVAPAGGGPSLYILFVVLNMHHT